MLDSVLEVIDPELVSVVAVTVLNCRFVDNAFNCVVRIILSIESVLPIILENPIVPVLSVDVVMIENTALFIWIEEPVIVNVERKEIIALDPDTVDGWIIVVVSVDNARVFPKREEIDRLDR